MEPEEQKSPADEQQELATQINEAEESHQSETGNEPLELDDPKSIELSSDYISRWSKLISTTNWEKGQIIFEWRQALMGSESPVSAYSDEAWSRRVGGVTPQHVGRLRRVYERFYESHTVYPGLYWSHFWAALDWDDAELWLAGASEGGLSVSQMRRTRWEATGADPVTEPDESQLVVTSDDEDYEPLKEVEEEMSVQDGTRAVAEGPRAEDPDFGDEAEVGIADDAAQDDDVLPWEEDGPNPRSPFADLPSLPTDIAEALEQFKLAIIRHRADSWAEVDQVDVVRAADALRLFAQQ